MSVTIRIPTPLRPYVGGAKEIKGSAGTVAEVLAALSTAYPELKRHLFNEEGKLRSFVNVYLGDEDVRHLQGPDTPVPDGATLSIVPSVAGGTAPASVVAETNDVRLSNEEIRRYSRHLILPEIAMAGQKKLKQASVLLVGVGGLGAPAAMYLAAAGVGHLGIVDFDVVDESNLQRQVIHGQSTVGKPKLQSAAQRIRDINPFVEVTGYEEPLTSQNALRIFADYDVIVDGTDNFPTRYLVNDACVLLGKPNVYGSIFRFEGQASVFWAEHGPCYRCLYPEPPPPGLVPSCAEGGVLGVLPGVIGVIQATEAIKLITGVGEPLIGRLLLYDALEMRFRELKLRKDPACPICGERPTIRELIDYEAFCGVPLRDGAARDAASGVPEITVQELKQRLEAGLEQTNALLIDVREPYEWQIAHLDAARLIPKGEIQNHLHELSQADEILVYCRSGARSADVVRFLINDVGFRKVKNVKGGILAWAREIDPRMPVY
ncbi:MAG: molybdopterin-synthase adenylyltransferase MoeB [Thermoflexales bacterium]|nr:molybdopterin-synthase adenylyltransferase MoeB [Thermoflexales bacterium]MDW8351447.1 molybdopterin-synthase adenylyltransferase MoeB [Anaerolineae bacterium]